MLGFWTAFKVAIAVCIAYAMIPVFIIVGIALLIGIVFAVLFGGAYILDTFDRMWRYCTCGKEYRARRREIKQHRKKRW